MKDTQLDLNVFVFKTAILKPLNIQQAKGVNYRSPDITRTQQQRPEPAMVTLTWYARKYKGHKLFQIVYKFVQKKMKSDETVNQSPTNRKLQKHTDK